MNLRQRVVLDGLGIMCRIFWGPDSETCAEMVQGAYHRRLESLHSVLKGQPLATLQHMISLVKSFPESNSLREYLEEGYVRLFVSARQGITAPLYESCYAFDDAPLMGVPAVAMKERLESKGLIVSDRFCEPPDHISVELEYLYFLLQHAWADQNRSFAADAAFFTSTVMLPWVSKLKERLAGEAQCLFYPFAACLLVALLQQISEEDGGTPSGNRQTRGE